MSDYDFLLSSRGDILFEAKTKDELEQFVFNFHCATSDSLLFNFFADISGTKEREPEMFQFNFETYSVLNDKKSKIATGDDFIKQAIKLQLETEINTLRENYDVGSEIYKYRHMFMQESNIIKNIEECAYNAIKDIVPNCEIKIYLQKTAYYDFYNAIKISVTFLDKIMWFTL